MRETIAARMQIAIADLALALLQGDAFRISQCGLTKHPGDREA
jgi:hypothetical protein